MLCPGPKKKKQGQPAIGKTEHFSHVRAKPRPTKASASARDAVGERAGRRGRRKKESAGERERERERKRERERASDRAWRQRRSWRHMGAHLLEQDSTQAELGELVCFAALRSI